MPELRQSFYADTPWSRESGRITRNPGPQPPVSEAWRENAKCQREHKPTDFFYPGRGIVDSAEIRAYCANCPVRLDCLEFALQTTAGRYGYWGGVSDRERRRIRAKRKMDAA